jgi:hypothetical protein
MECLHKVLGRNLVPAWPAFFACSNAIHLLCVIVFDY